MNMNKWIWINLLYIFWDNWFLFATIQFKCTALSAEKMVCNMRQAKTLSTCVCLFSDTAYIRTCILSNLGWQSWISRFFFSIIRGDFVLECWENATRVALAYSPTELNEWTKNKKNLEILICHQGIQGGIAIKHSLLPLQRFTSLRSEPLFFIYHSVL